MAYNQFTLQRVEAEFGLTLATPPDLFPGVPPVPLPPGLREQLVTDAALASTEAARSHFLIAPLLRTVWKFADRRVALFAGARFDVDEAAGLTGVCDFILGRPPQLPYVRSPVLMIVEAKNEDVLGGLGQCAAAMVAAQRFNAAKKSDIDTIYGAVSDGERWRFLRLCGAALDIEVSDRFISYPDQLLGILFHIVGVTPPVQPAPVAA